MSEREASSPSRWERVGRRAVWSEATYRFHEFERRYRDIVETIDSGGDPTVQDLRELREAHRELQTVIEDRFAAGIDGAEPWEGATNRIPYGKVAEALGISLSELKEADL